MKTDLLQTKSFATESIKYAGSKRRLLGQIFFQIQQLPGICRILDGFSGSTRVSQLLAQAGYTVTSNDVADWSYILGLCYLKSTKPDSFYQPFIEHLNALPPRDGWFSVHYGGTEKETKKPFRLKNMQKLDAIRPEIDKFGLSREDSAVLLTSLLLALDKVDSTLGHFSSYLSRWSIRSKNDLKLVLPKRFPIQKEHGVFKQDIFKTIKGGDWDLAYFDPPYGSNNNKMPSSRIRYAGYYHFWKTVIQNDSPPLFGAAKRRTDSRDEKSSSVFENFHQNDSGKWKALEALETLLEKTPARYLMLSYSSTGRIPQKELLECLTGIGTLVNFLEVDYNKNIMAKLESTHAWSNPTKNSEYLFIVKKKN